MRTIALRSRILWRKEVSRFEVEGRYDLIELAASVAVQERPSILTFAD